MRAALIIAMATLTLGLTSHPMHGQMRTDVSPLLSIKMIDAQIGWAATRQCGPCPSQHIPGAMLRTINGGTLWNDVTPLDSSGRRITVVSFHALDALIAWAAGAATGTPTAQVFRTVDGGRTWRRATVGVNAESISSISGREGWVLSTVDVFMGFRHVVDIYRTTDGGETWNKVATTSPEGQNIGLSLDGSKDRIYFLNGTTGWITGTDYLFITHDGGRTWRQQTLPLPSQVGSTFQHDPGSPWSRPPVFFTARDGVLPVFFTYRNSRTSILVFYMTHDGGATWMSIAPVLVVQRWTPVSFADMNHGWVVDGNKLYVTGNGGRRWMTIRPNPLFADVTQLDFISPLVGWAVRKTFPFLLKTLDGGRTWTPVTYTISRR